MSAGYYKMHRGWQDHAVFRNAVYSRRDAWIWLVENACWKPTRFDVRGKTITLERGQLAVSVRQMAEKWGWSPAAVNRFLKRLKTETMIEQQTETGKSIVTIRNYAKYQHREDESETPTETPSGTPAKQKRNTKQEGKKERKEPKGSKGAIFVCPDGVEPDHWRDFLDNRKRKKAVNSETAYKRVLSDLDKHSHSGWTKDALVRHAAEEGWKGIYFPNCEPPAAKTQALPDALQAEWNELADQRARGEIDDATYNGLTAKLFRRNAEQAPDPPNAVAKLIHQATR